MDDKENEVWGVGGGYVHTYIHRKGEFYLTARAAWASHPPLNALRK